MRKTLTVILWCFAALLLCAGIAVTLYAVKRNSCARSNAAPEIVAGFSVPEKGVPLAQRIRLSARIITPWARSAVSPELQPGMGAQVVVEPRITEKWFAWGKTCWTVQAEIQPYLAGQIPEGTLNIVFEGGPEKEPVSLKIPSFKALPVPSKDGSLLLAGELAAPETGKKNLWWYLVAAAVIAAVILLLFLRRKKKTLERQHTIWENALESILCLKESLHSGKTLPEPAVAALNDLVRNYLELRFRMHAEHQTTREFLDELGKGGPLNEEQTRFLKEFLSSSDLVKFARLPADTDLFDNAADHADSLIRSTAEPEPAKEKKQ